MVHLSAAVAADYRPCQEDEREGREMISLSPVVIN